ncbi:MAG: hypothetical protein DRQ45_04310 [Gammaproteobacteria bacterium]|nr:MAG: hypothetical protein DRQ45_04310 [Gammaproteobacteria bacterium]
MNAFMHHKQPVLGVSSCLLGMNVRYDGSGKQHSFISSILDKYFELLPICPEVAIGMGVPRAPIQLRILDDQLHAVEVGNHAQDVTLDLQAYGQQQATQAHAFCGYIFKSSSPSCGISDSTIFSEHADHTGPGIYTREILHALPCLPVIDERQLDRKEAKDNFMERVFAQVRWNQILTGPMTVKLLIGFHMTHHLTLSAHCEKSHEALSASLSGLHDPLSRDAINNYLKQFHAGLRVPLTHDDHVRMLTKLQRCLSTIISSGETGKLDTEIRKYMESSDSLVTSLQLIKELADAYNLYHLSRQTYINPIPAEIALRFSTQQEKSYDH